MVTCPNIVSLQSKDLNKPDRLNHWLSQASSTFTFCIEFYSTDDYSLIRMMICEQEVTAEVRELVTTFWKAAEAELR